eukprot:m.156477 g.156477  ORF g.156477 m.156477 type:complete len:327 (+) comp10218_c0_seq4:556-1536(+)
MALLEEAVHALSACMAAKHLDLNVFFFRRHLRIVVSTGESIAMAMKAAFGIPMNGHIVCSVTRPARAGAAGGLEASLWTPELLPRRVPGSLYLMRLCEKCRRGGVWRTARSNGSCKPHSVIARRRERELEDMATELDTNGSVSPSAIEAALSQEPFSMPHIQTVCPLTVLRAPGDNVTLFLFPPPDQAPQSIIGRQVILRFAGHTSEHMIVNRDFVSGHPCVSSTEDPRAVLLAPQSTALAVNPVSPVGSPPGCMSASASPERIPGPAAVRHVEHELRGMALQAGSLSTDSSARLSLAGELPASLPLAGELASTLFAPTPMPKVSQ